MNNNMNQQQYNPHQQQYNNQHQQHFFHVNLNDTHNYNNNNGNIHPLFPPPPDGVSTAGTANLVPAFLTSPSALHVPPQQPVETAGQQQQPQLPLDHNNSNVDNLEDDHTSSITGTTPSTTAGKHRSWEDNFAALAAYKEQFGDCFVPVGYAADPTLGRWCAKLRKLQSTLNKERKARLEYLGFCFVNPKQALEDKNWNDNFEKLKEYYAATSTSSQQQQQSGQTTINTNNNNNNLEYHPNHPPFALPTTTTTTNTQNSSHHHKIHSTTSSIKMDPVLNRWVSRQRRNKKDGILSQERQEKLESIGFRWVLVEQKRKDYSKKDLVWIQQYNALAKYKAEHDGDCNPPHNGSSKHNNHNNPYGAFAKWVARQRELYTQKRLLPDRQELLDQLGFCWSMEDKAWRDNFARLAAHIRDYHHLDFQQQQDPSLGRWFYAQRIRHANGQLQPDRTLLLKSVGIVFEGTKARLRRDDEEEDDEQTQPEDNSKVATNDTATTNNNTTSLAAEPPSDQLLFTVDFPMKPSKGTKIRKKRFMDGWCNGQVIDTDTTTKDNNNNIADANSKPKAKIRFTDGEEEYLSDEECRIGAIAYQLYAKPPKLKLTGTTALPPPSNLTAKATTTGTPRRKRGRPPKNATTTTANQNSGKQKKRAASTTTKTAKKKVKTTTAAKRPASAAATAVTHTLGGENKEQQEESPNQQEGMGTSMHPV